MTIRNTNADDELNEIIEQLRESDGDSLLRREELLNQLHDTDDIYLVE